MPQSVEFEEKEFERPLYSELAAHNPRVWPPGQVLEAHLGFDVAMDVAMHPVWGILGIPSSMPGIILRDEPNLVRVTGIPKARLPSFKTNLFIQAKRPQVLKRRTRGLSATGIGSPYWRFTIDHAQHATFFIVATLMGSRALFAYAAPAFSTSADLFEAMLKREVCARTNFVRVRDLEIDEHDHWAYSAPGASGYACSEPRPISGGSLDLMLSRSLEESDGPARGDDLGLDSLYSSFFGGMGEGRGTSSRVREVMSVVERLEFGSSPAGRFLGISVASHLLNLGWWVTGAENGNV